MGVITDKDIKDLQKENMLEYFLSVLYDRSISDIRDGLKPVQRAILWEMYISGYNSSKPHVKCAKVSGGVIGAYHPHGDASVYDAMARMSQDFINNQPLISWHGNNGSIQGFNQAASRYTECRLSKFSEEMMENINKRNVKMIPNYDNTLEMPETLPCKLPLVLINGSYGIAAGGFSQFVPPHNLVDVCDIVKEVLTNPDISVHHIAKKLVPDFPTGGILCSKIAIQNAYETGKGTVKLRAKMEVDSNKNIITITEIPYLTTIGPHNTGGSETLGILNSIVNKIKDGTIEGIKNIEDHSDKKICIKIFLKKDYDPQTIINLLYKNTPLERTINIILVAKNGNFFKQYNIKDYFTEFIKYRIDCIRKEIIFDINKYKKELHINSGLLIALTDIDKVISIIKKSKSKDDAKVNLLKNFKLTELQVNSILDMKLSVLTNLEKIKIQERIDELNKLVENLKVALLESNIKDRIKNEQDDLIKKFGNERRTSIEEIDTNITYEQTIIDEDTLVVMTKDNYIKRIDNTIPTQHKNTKGISIGSNNIVNIFSTTTKSHLLCVTNTGRVCDIKVYDIDKSSDIKNKGRRIENYLNLKSNETIINILCISDMQFNDLESFIILVTKNGIFKKIRLDQFVNARKNGIIAIILKKDDEVVSVNYIDGSKKMQDIIFATKDGLVARYDSSTIKEMSRNSNGFTAMKLENNDKIIGSSICESNNDVICFATKHGYGKIVKITDNVKKKDPKSKKEVNINDGFPRLIRSSSIKGRLGIKLRNDDELVSIIDIKNPDEKLIVLSNKNILSIESSEFSKPTKRTSMGYSIINLANDDELVKIIKA